METLTRWQDPTIDELRKEIKQLKKRNKEIYDGFMATTQELTECAEENEKLKRENNLLKADIEASQEIICDYKKEEERLNNIIANGKDKTQEVKEHIDKSKFDGTTKLVLLMALNEIIYTLNGKGLEEE